MHPTCWETSACVLGELYRWTWKALASGEARRTRRRKICVWGLGIYGYNRGRTAAGLCRQTSKTTEHDVRMLRQWQPSRVFNRRWETHTLSSIPNSSFAPLEELDAVWEVVGTLVYMQLVILIHSRSQILTVRSQTACNLKTIGRLMWQYLRF